MCGITFLSIQADEAKPKQNEKQKSSKDTKERITSVLKDVKNDDLWLLRYARAGVLADEIGESAIPKFFQALMNKNEKVIDAAGFALARLFTKHPVPKEMQDEIVNLTKSQVVKRRYWALCFLQFFEHPKRVEILTDRIKNDTDPDVRDCALETLRSFWHDKKIVPICIKALSDDNWKVVSAARLALLNLTCLHFGFRVAVVKDTEAKRKTIAKWWDWWEKNKDKSIEEWHYQALKDPNSYVRFWGVINVGDLADERRDYEFIEIAIDNSENTSKLLPPEPPFEPPPGWPRKLDKKATIALYKMLNDKQTKVRRLAAKALAIRRDRSVIPTLKELLKAPDREFRARQNAAYLLAAYYGDKSGVDVLIRDLNNTKQLLPDYKWSSVWIRLDAVKLLRKLVGQNFDYVEPPLIVFDEKKEKQNEFKRKKALKLWKEWWKNNREKLIWDKEKKMFSLGQQ